MSACHSFLKRAAGLALVLCAGIVIGWRIPRSQSRQPLAAASVAPDLAELPVATEPVPPPAALPITTCPPPENAAARPMGFHSLTMQGIQHNLQLLSYDPVFHRHRQSSPVQ